jgi:hypothetical protein
MFGSTTINLYQSMVEMLVYQSFEDEKFIENQVQARFVDKSELIDILQKVTLKVPATILDVFRDNHVGGYRYEEDSVPLTEAQLREMKDTLKVG